MSLFRRSPLESRLHDHAAGDLDPSEAAALERRLGEDPAARALQEEVLAAREALRSLRERPEPPAPADEALARIRAAIAADRLAPRPYLPLEGQGARFYRRLALAATLLFAITAGFLAASPRGEPAAPPAVLAVPAPLAPPPPPEARGIDLLVDAGRHGGLTAREYLEMLRRLGVSEHDTIYSPMMVPVTAESSHWR
ncbi:MAG: anti-sigma factor family protein [Planctomycetaceae bacterium]